MRPAWRKHVLLQSSFSQGTGAVGQPPHPHQTPGTVVWGVGRGFTPERASQSPAHTPPPPQLPLATPITQMSSGGDDLKASRARNQGCRHFLKAWLPALLASPCCPHHSAGQQGSRGRVGGRWGWETRLEESFYMPGCSQPLQLLNCYPCHSAEQLPPVPSLNQGDPSLRKSWESFPWLISWRPKGVAGGKHADIQSPGRNSTRVISPWLFTGCFAPRAGIFAPGEKAWTPAHLSSTRNTPILQVETEHPHMAIGNAPLVTQPLGLERDAGAHTVSQSWRDLFQPNSPLEYMQQWTYVAGY